MILSCQELRKLSKNLELSYHNVIYQIQSEHKGYRLRKASILVSENTQGIVTLWYKGKWWPYTTITKQQRRTDVLNHKEKDHRVDVVVATQRNNAYKPAANHPWKRQVAMMVRKNQQALSPALASPS
ncbi:MAG: hypothetical protein JSR33_07780 [Proteobacteria bacterium]|nr:hypothetical protein [Pseudomonadota bacterium]